MGTLNTSFNPYLILLCGNPSTGKTYSLKGLEHPERWLYINCETGKSLPFRFKEKGVKFKEVLAACPEHVEAAFQFAESNKEEIDGIIVDSLTFLMEMYISQKIIPSADTRKAWQNYGEFIRNLLQNLSLRWGKPVIFIAHVSENYNEDLSIKGTKVPIKGQVGEKGIEAYFNSVIYTRQIPLIKLEKYKENNELLHVTKREEELGFKYVFQTLITKETVGDRIRNPEECFSDSETYIDNNIQLVLNRLNDYYS